MAYISKLSQIDLKGIEVTSENLEISQWKKILSEINSTSISST